MRYFDKKPTDSVAGGPGSENTTTNGNSKMDRRLPFSPSLLEELRVIHAPVKKQTAQSALVQSQPSERLEQLKSDLQSPSEAAAQTLNFIAENRVCFNDFDFSELLGAAIKNAYHIAKLECVSVNALSLFMETSLSTHATGSSIYIAERVLDDPKTFSSLVPLAINAIEKGLNSDDAQSAGYLIKHIAAKEIRRKLYGIALESPSSYVYLEAAEHILDDPKTFSSLVPQAIDSVEKGLNSDDAQSAGYLIKHIASKETRRKFYGIALESPSSYVYLEAAEHILEDQKTFSLFVPRAIDVVEAGLKSGDGISAQGASYLIKHIASSETRRKLYLLALSTTDKFAQNEATNQLFKMSHNPETVSKAAKSCVPFSKRFESDDSDDQETALRLALMMPFSERHDYLELARHSPFREIRQKANTAHFWWHAKVLFVKGDKEAAT